MQHFLKLASLLTVVAMTVSGNPLVQPEPSMSVNEAGSVPVNIMTTKELRNWIRTTQGEFKFIGEKFDLEDNPLTSRDACTTFSGSGACISAPNTNCLVATSEVQFCGSPGCGGICNSFNSCGTRLNNNFCFTPGTQSIRVP